MPQLPFIKAHGTENDFIVVFDSDLSAAGIELDAAFTRRLCDRRAGLGADGILNVVDDNGTWFMDYRNADGSTAEMCGNGIRVFAHALIATHRETAKHFRIHTRAGERHVEIVDVNQHTHSATVSVAMGDVRVTGISTVHTAGQTYAGLAVNVGNPHLACVVPELSNEVLAHLQLTPPEFDASFFPEGVNVELVTPLRDNEIAMRVWERGVGETKSCGTGTVAAAQAALADTGRATGTVTVHIPGGTVSVTIDDDSSALLTGPSQIVAEGHFNV